jgi:hypothetical protein
LITSQKLGQITTYSPETLALELAKLKIKHNAIAACAFLGITNGFQFCYRVDYSDQTLDRTWSKVFLTCDSAGTVVAASVG